MGFATTRDSGNRRYIMDRNYATQQNYASAAKDNELCKESVSTEVRVYAQSLAKRSAALACRVNDKLQSVMMVEPPQTGSSPIPTKLVNYPPLFSELHDSFLEIESALYSIECALGRTEL